MGKGKQDGESGSGKGDKDSSSVRRRSTKWDQKPLEDKSQGQDGQPKRPGFRLPEQLGWINEQRSSEADVRDYWRQMGCFIIDAAGCHDSRLHR